MLDYLRTHALRDDALQDLFSSVSERIERIERNQVLLLTENNPQKVEQARAELEIELAIKQELRKRQRNLNKLKNKAAEYGTIDVPLDLENKIEAEQEAIERLKSELA